MPAVSQKVSSALCSVILHAGKPSATDSTPAVSLTIQALMERTPARSAHAAARCIVCDDDCTYGEGPDGRRAYSRAYVKSLEARVAYLEGLMQEPEAAQRADEGLKVGTSLG